MKKLLYLFPLLFGLRASAQDSVVFRMKYLPQHVYEMNVGYNVNCKLNISGDQKVTDKLKAQGITQPINLLMKFGLIANAKTGDAAGNGEFPFTMDYKLDNMSININGKEIPIPMQQLSAGNVSLYGHVGTDGKLNADSVKGTAKDTSREKLSRMINAFQSHIKFPDHAMRIGDTFTQEMPFSLPLGGNSNTNITSKAVYKLTSIADGKAYFDVTQSIDMSMQLKGQTFTVTGSGTGKVVFNIAESFMDSYQADINLKFSGKVNTMEIAGAADMQMDYQNAISANPQ